MRIGHSLMAQALVLILWAGAAMWGATPAHAQDVRRDDSVAPASPGPSEPLAGVSGDTAFLRSSNNLFVLFPSARLQVDGLFFSNQVPKSGFALRQVRLELAGWIGPAVYYTFGGNFAAAPPAERDAVSPSNLAATDAFIALAPWGDVAILQMGQFDAPFTLENRISDKYLNFTERSLTVRVLGAPTNKEVGLMLHGTDQRRLIYYSAGFFNGDGPNFRNVDNQFDLIGRGWVAPLALAPVRRITIGGSFRSGRHLQGLPFPAQATAGGLRFFEPRWSIGRGTPTVLELHQQGRMYSWAVEVDAPLSQRLGVRGEFVSKHQQLAANDITAASDGIVTFRGNAVLDGIAAYGEIWWWLIGDDRILPAPGLQLPTRLTSVVDSVAPYGLMVVLRGELLKEDLSNDEPALADPNQATTRVMSLAGGLNYWYSRRFRFSVNYVMNIFRGTTENIKVITATTPTDHEVLLRLAIAL